VFGALKSLGVSLDTEPSQEAHTSVTHRFNLPPPLLPKEDADHVEAGQEYCHGTLSRRGQCEIGQAMTIDTEIRHVTKAGGNLFLKLAFSAAEAKRLHAASRKPINDTRLLKQQPMAELSNWINEHPLRQADAAQIVSRPRVSDVVNQRPPGRNAQPLEQARAAGIQSKAPLHSGAFKDCCPCGPTNARGPVWPTSGPPEVRTAPESAVSR
jgi:hypothetical protein